MPTKYADLEIGISRRDDSAYSVSFRLTQPESDEMFFERGEIQQADLNSEDLRDALADPGGYGQLLTERFFKESKITEYYKRFTSMVLSQADTALRLRFNIGMDAPELHRLHWELLREPGTDSLIATNQNILLSRYLSSRNLRPSQLKSRDEMKALVVIVNPSDLGTGKLPAPINAAGELARAKQGLKDIPVTAFPEPGDNARATLDNIITNFSGKDYDILYLVCHGSFNDSKEPMLLLEDEEGKAKRTSGKAFAVRMRELLHRPKLIVLASCESAGTETGNALAAFGPSLIDDAGVPAVLAMQGRVSMKTVEKFMPVFFDELRKHGYIDQALAVARGMVRGNDDFWMPVLYMRLTSGRLWYVPGYTTKFDLWDVLKVQIEDEEQPMTPIIGAGVFQPLLGSMRDISESWAQKFSYPLAPYERDSMAKVAQFIYAVKTKKLVFQNLQDSLRADILEDFKDELSEKFLPPNKVSASALISEIGRLRRQNNPNDSYNILARLPMKVYITTNYNNLLTDALVEAGKHPRVMICPWNKEIAKKYKPDEKKKREEKKKDEFEPEEGFEPDINNPLIFHMFGRLDEPESLVLTEDDYFDFLLGYSRNIDLMPGPVTEALSDSAWLFLGFQMEDWAFRVLFRSILSREGGGVTEDIKHVAAQFVPEEGRISDSDGAQRYLEKYFGKNKIDLYWGSAEEFLQELAKHMDLQLA